jgi:Gas vesicle synthesis protein GvpL/GvpF
MTESCGVWTYAVTEHADARDFRDVPGVGGGPVRAVAAAALTAVAGTVRLDEYGEAALRRNLEDLDWLAAVARAHHEVIDAVVRRGPTVPMRLATVFSADDSLAAMLAERAVDFRQTLLRVGTRKEWGVKAYPADQRGSATPAAGHGVAAMAGGEPASGGPGGPGTGAAYLRRRRSQLSAAKDASRLAAASIRDVHEKLSRIAAGSRLHAPQAPQLTGGNTPMLLNAAYLLEESAGDTFAAAVAALAGGHPGIRLELTGPWPPYSFTGTDDGGAGGLTGSAP